MDEQIKIGVFGMGKMVILHTAILSSLDGVEVKAVADKQDLILSFIKGSLPSIKTYKDYNEVLKKEDLGYKSFNGYSLMNMLKRMRIFLY